MMKLSARTIQILKNFSLVNQSLWFKQGHVIKTASPIKTIMATATVDEYFDTEFGIYDLSKFLGVLTLFENPDITITPNVLTVSGNGRRVDITHVSKEIVAQDVDKIYNANISLPQVDVQFALTAECQQTMIKALGMLQLPHVAICGENGVLLYRGLDCGNKTTNKYEIVLGECVQQFQIVFKSENMKLIPDNYTVSLSSRGPVQVKSSDIEYWIVAESNLSSFGG